MKKNTWGATYPAKAATVVLTTLFLWGTGLSLLAVILEAVNGFASDPAEVDAAFVQRISNDAYSDLYSYVGNHVTNAQDAGYPVPADSLSYDRDPESYYLSRFDPTRTNLRFFATDSNGSVILSNDSSLGENTEVLGKQTIPMSYTISDRDYSVQHHFDDFDTLQQADMPSLLDSPGDFRVWYFSDDSVQYAYENGVDAVIASNPYMHAELFDSEEAARQFEYEETFGPGTTWEILNAADSGKYMDSHEIGNGSDEEEFHAVTEPPLSETEQIESSAAIEGQAAVSADHPIVVLVNSYQDMEYRQVDLAEYYHMKARGINIYAQDTQLEQQLAKGLDVTVTANKLVTENVNVTVWLPAALPVNDSIRSNYAIFSLLRGKAEIISAALFFFGMATVISAIAMCSAAGHVEGSDAIVVPRVHNLPYGIFWALPAATIAAGIGVFTTLWSTTSSWRIQLIFAAGMTLCIALTGVLWLYTTAVRAKAGTFWSSFGLVRLFRAGFGLMRHKTGTCILIGAGFTGLCLLNGIAAAIASAGNGLILLPAIGLDLLALILILYSIYSYFTLHQHMKQISLGRFEPEQYVIPLAGDFLTFDSELNTLTVSVGEMVAQQMKAEHLRTELITNVSHDLKTPLTSIVNYVDLLSREPIESEEAREYLDVLRRQAARLKKLTTDLVDASKASTGNITVEMQTTNVQVLLGQFGGEYEERLRQCDLELVLSLPDPAVYILADGRQIMRVFDNLLNNACKYAMKGTRVYLSAAADSQTVTITMKNVSAAPLNVSPDELMERFVRGDSSRHTEGSGLGLSIARDLTALQGGTLTLHTDGDLFKAVLSFPRYEPPAVIEA